MVSADRAKELLSEAHDFLNGTPEDRVQEFLLAKETTEESDEKDEASPQNVLEIVKVPLHENIHTELNGIFVDEMYKILSDVVKQEERPISRYSAGNIHKEKVPIQYIPFNEIPDYKLFHPLSNSNSFREDSYNGLGSADFQVLRVRDKWGNMFLAFRKFTRNQIVGSSWKVKLTLSGNEYDKFEEDLFALPEKFDAFLFNDYLFVVNQGKFEDIFNYFSEYEKRTERVLEGLKESEITIHNTDFFKNAINNDKLALRKMAVVEEEGLYKELTPEKVKDEIEQYNLNVETKEIDGEWGLTLPSKGDKRDLIKILNDDNLFSESTETRYQTTGGKRQV